MAKYDIVTDKLNNFFTNNKLTISPNQPASGTYKKGDMVLSSNPTPEVYGWICTADGTPGQWQALKSATNISMPEIPEITKEIIENTLTGQIDSHSHFKLDVIDGRTNMRNPKDIGCEFNVRFAARDEVGLDNQASDHNLNIMTMKGWHDVSGGHATQLGFNYHAGSKAPAIYARSGANDGDLWERWWKVFTNAENMISCNNDTAGDYGFGSNGKPGGFIGVYPGWDSNGLWINCYSNQGQQEKAFDNVHILGNWVEVHKILRAGSIESNWIDNIVKLQFTNKFSTQYIMEGNGDGASWDTQNLIIRSWWGIGFRDNNDNTNILFDCRNGRITVKERVVASICESNDRAIIRGTNVYVQGDDPGAVGAGSIWIKSV